MNSKSINDATEEIGELDLEENSIKKICSVLKKPDTSDKILVSNFGKDKTIEIPRAKRETNIELKKVNNLNLKIKLKHIYYKRDVSKFIILLGFESIK